MVSLTNLLNHFQSAVWLPWLIYFWERTVKTERWSALVAFSIVSLCQLLAGSPEIFTLSIGLVVLDTFACTAKGRPRFLPEYGYLIGAGVDHHWTRHGSVAADG